MCWNAGFYHMTRRGVSPVRQPVAAENTPLCRHMMRMRATRERWAGRAAFWSYNRVKPCNVTHAWHGMHASALWSGDTVLLIAGSYWLGDPTGDPALHTLPHHDYKWWCYEVLTATSWFVKHFTMSVCGRAYAAVQWKELAWGAQ